MKKLQVFIDGDWEYVFGRDDKKVLPFITKDKNKAITEKFGDGQRILNYFNGFYGSLKFRLSA